MYALARPLLLARKRFAHESRCADCAYAVRHACPSLNGREARRALHMRQASSAMPHEHASERIRSAVCV
eukprot:23885-Pleurochrysis_carterae.AAC.1